MDEELRNSWCGSRGIPVRLSILTMLNSAIPIVKYRTRALRATNSADKSRLSSHWQAAHDMCSVAACNMAFDECKESDEGYDLGMSSIEKYE
jgi:hypothetical protein